MSQVSSVAEKNSGLSPEFRTLALPIERQRQVMWLMFGAFILLLAAAAQIIAPPDASFTGKNAAAAINLANFHIAGISLAAFSLLLRTYAYSDRRLVAMLQSRKMLVPAALSGPFERSAWRLFQATLPVQVLGWVANESIMLIGLWAVAADHPAAASYPFVFIALTLQILSFPRFLPLALRARKLWQQHHLGPEL